jgi:hypothetical protein
METIVIFELTSHARLFPSVHSVKLIFRIVFGFDGLQ